MSMVFAGAADMPHVRRHVGRAGSFDNWSTHYGEENTRQQSANATRQGRTMPTRRRSLFLLRRTRHAVARRGRLTYIRDHSETCSVANPALSKPESRRDLPLSSCKLLPTWTFW